MDKKLRLSISYVVLISLFVGGTILYSKPADKSKFTSKSVYEKNYDASLINENKSIYDKNIIVKSENINISNNAPEIDLRASLTENNTGQVSLALSYKLKGKNIAKNLDTSSIAEIRNIFRFREKYKSGYRLKNMILNRKMNKLYFCVEGRKEKSSFHTTIYSYNLDNEKAEKIFYNIGQFSNFFISPDESFNAFSYSDGKSTDQGNKNLVVILCCRDNSFILNDSMDSSGKTIGEDSYMFAYSYEFVKWHSADTCILKQRAGIKDGSRKVSEQPVYYNVASNKLYDKL